jgi:uncharacterized membrane protein
MEKVSHFARVRGWYKKFERPISSLSLIGGFVFDALTLKRVDMFWENFWIVAHLAIVAACILVLNIKENEGSAEADPEKLHFWLVNILQFFFGGLLSTYLVFYFRSGTIAASWPFFVILAATFIANESLKRHYARLTFQISVLYLSILLFSIYLVPVVVHTIGPGVFILSGLVSIMAIALFIFILKISAREKFVKSRWFLYLAIGGIFAGMNALYFFNLIPPIPLSLKDAGIYQIFTVNAPGNYTAGHEDQGFLNFLHTSDDLHVTAGEAIYAYSAIFSPTSFSLNIIHEWQYYDQKTGTWITRGKIHLSVIGGSDGGYRTFSIEDGLTPGKWRVNVETSRGEIIGRMIFNVIIATSTPTLQTVQIN